MEERKTVGEAGDGLITQAFANHSKISVKNQEIEDVNMVVVPKKNYRHLFQRSKKENC